MPAGDVGPGDGAAAQQVNESNTSLIQCVVVAVVSIHDAVDQGEAID